MENALQDAGGQTLSEKILCRLDEIDDPGGKGFEVEGRQPVFVIRKDGALHGYMNVCPHQGTPLDWKPDTFLTVDKDMIQCATHWALFRIEDGHCLKGPCIGRSLTPVEIELRDGEVVLILD